MRIDRYFLAFTSGLALATALPAQAPVEPTAYTVTVRVQITGTVMRTTYRLGSKVLVDQTTPSDAVGEPPGRTRTLYNLETKESLSWNPSDPSAPCTRSHFSGDEWLDFFSGGPDLTMKNVTHAGTETLHGVATVILESSKDPDTTSRLWVDPLTGLMWKAQFVSKKLGQTLTWFEVTDVSLQPPPSSVFAIPARCLANSPAR
jgi:hypothetical protein